MHHARKRSRLPRPEAGTTLVEVMISLAVLGFALLAFLSIMHSANTLSVSSREGVVAAHELQSAVEDTFAVPFDTFLINFTSGTAFQGQVGADGITTLPNYYHSPIDTPIGPRPLRNEEIKIVWQDPSAPVTDQTYAEYRLEITFTNHKGKKQFDYIVTKRSK